jgi:pyruvate dehydrogenase E1 component alpha subunit
VDSDAAAYASELRARCLALPDPHMLDMFDSVYAEQTPLLATQKTRYADYLQSFEDAEPAEEPRPEPVEGQDPQPAYGGVH